MRPKTTGSPEQVALSTQHPTAARRTVRRPARTRVVRLIALGLACVAAWLYTGGYETLRRALSTPNTGPAGSGLVQTNQPYLRAQYDRIREGMDLEAVRRTMGGPGELVSGSRTPAVPGVRAPIDTLMYMWENADGGNCHVMFQNGHVVSKAQVGLP